MFNNNIYFKNYKYLGTDAKVTISIFGTEGQLLNIPLDKSNNKNPFEKDNLDIFNLKEKYIGKVKLLFLNVHQNNKLEILLTIDFKNNYWS